MRALAMFRAARAARPLAIALTAVCAVVGPVAAQDTEPTDRSDEPIFVGTDLVFVGAVGIGTLAVSPFDKAFADYLQGDLQTRRALRRLSWTVENITQPGAWVIGGGLYLAGKAFDNDRMETLGLRGTEAIVIGLTVATVLKVGAGRARPFVNRDPRDFKFGRGLGDTRYSSFPSGHSVMAWAAAVVVTEQTRRWWDGSQWYIGPLMYGGATLVAVSRMYDNKHWATDVLMGSAIGAFTGVKVMKYHTTRPDNKIDEWFIGGSLVAKPGGGYAFRPLVFPRLSR
jgi:membrane-associated phospholipid phosphatase